MPLSYVNFLCVFFPTAKKFGVTEFVNPKDHNKPVQEVSSPTFLNFVQIYIYI